MRDLIRERLQAARQHAGDGDHFLAFDVATQTLKEVEAETGQGPASGLPAAVADIVGLKHLACLSLARTGATAAARHLYDECGLCAPLDASLPEKLVVDVEALAARIAKDEALADRGHERRDKLRRAAELYEHAHRRSGDPYPGVNAATLRLLAGDLAEAEQNARSVLAGCDAARARGGGDYWNAATMAEAAAVFGDEALRTQIVIHFTGHLPGPRFPAERIPAVGREIKALLDTHDVGVGYGSLAAGADILFAEALLAKGARLHLVFPFEIDEFRRLSVASAGAAWLERFETCLAQARTVNYATEDAYLGDDMLFTYASRFAMGLAMVHARGRDAPVRQMAVWDGGQAGGATGVAGTTADVGFWRGLGLPADAIVPAGHAVDVRSAGSTPDGWHDRPDGRVLRAMLFGDLKGFSKLKEPQLKLYAAEVLGALARVLDDFGPAVHFRNTWGDGLFVVVEDVEVAADIALALQAAITGLDKAKLGLPETIGLRLGGHAGPVFAAYDPVIRQTNFIGSHVSRTARIEPVTPEGSVYVTDAFAALLTARKNRRFDCDYVGMVPAAKGYGTMRMFTLRQRT